MLLAGSYASEKGACLKDAVSGYQYKRSNSSGNTLSFSTDWRVNQSRLLRNSSHEVHGGHA